VVQQILNPLKPTNQPTRNLTKGSVLRKMSSLARLNHFCVRNAQPGLEKGPWVQ